MSAARLFFCFALMMLAGLGTWALAADDAAARTVVHKESLGGLRLEQPASEVIKLLGKPEKETKLVFQAADGNYVQTWKYPSKGIELSISAGAKPSGKKTVATIMAQSPCALATTRGIKIGSPAAAAKKVYEAWIDRESSTPDSLVVASIYDGIIFHFDHGQVSRIFFGAAAE